MKHFVSGMWSLVTRTWAWVPTLGEVVSAAAGAARAGWRLLRSGARALSGMVGRLGTQKSGARRPPRAPTSDRARGERTISDAKGREVRRAADAARETGNPRTEPIAVALMDRLSELERDVPGLTPDAVALLEDLRTLQPSMIRQPAGAAQKVLHLLNDGNYTGAQLASVIETDPAIAQTLLRHANSTWYEGSDVPPLTSLVAAARRIGTKGVHAAVMSVVMEGGFVSPGAGLDNLARRVWDHMVRVAPMARQLGHAFGGDADTAFTLGLCHDVGKLVLFERVAELRRRLRRQPHFPAGFFGGALRQLHEPLGGIAALSWGLPASFARIVASHHRDPPPSGADPLSEALFLAERLDLAVHYEHPFDLEQIWKRGALTIPIEVGGPWVRRVDQEAVQAALDEAKRARELGAEARDPHSQALAS